MENIPNKGTEAEEFVYNLSKDKLLENYCLLNPTILNSDSKEVCDLIIIGNDFCLLISVKNYRFLGNYDRFDNKVFVKSKKQLIGAKRKLLLKEKCILIDKNKKQKEFDTNVIKKLILITINFGHELENYKIVECENENIIHNLDRDTFETIVFEIDSIPEVVDYFGKKELLYKGKKSLTIVGREKDLLAYFLTNRRNFPKEWVDNENQYLILEIEGRWNQYDSHEQTQEKRKANKISYFVDELIKREVSLLPKLAVVSDYLMGLSRLQRRLFAINFFEHAIKNKNRADDFLSRRMIFDAFPDASCLLLYYSSSMPTDIIDEHLNLAGEIYLYKYAEFMKKLVVIAVPKNYHPLKFGYLERHIPFSETEISFYENAIKEFDWFTSQKFSSHHIEEYPKVKQKTK